MLNKKTFKIKGMHCASCAQIIESKLKKIDGINKIAVNFATEKVAVEFDSEKSSLEKMNQEISKLGYRFEIDNKEDNSNKDKIQNLKLLFVIPVGLLTFSLKIRDLLALIWPKIPSIPIQTKHWDLILMFTSLLVIILVGRPFLKGIINFVKFRVANMDTLIGLGTMTAFLYSTIIILFPAIKIKLNLPNQVYFDTVIGIIAFVTLGKYLESRSKAKTGETIKKLLGLQAKTALVQRNGKEIEIPMNQVILGDIVIIKPGMKIPIDGLIIEGSSSIDESMISGESMPIDKKVGDKVFGATINKQGSFLFKANKIGDKTLLSQIIKIVEEAQGSKAPIQSLADKISGIFVPVVLVIAILSFLVWLIIGQNLTFAILSLVGVLVIACPCALGLATPTAITVGVGRGAENGILIKNAESLERLSKVDIVVMDKTGTLTKGEPKVTDIVVLDKNFDEEKLLKYAASVEKLSEHPLAQTIVKEAKDRNIELLKCSDFLNKEGIGVQGKVNNKKVIISKSEQKNNKLASQGKTVVDIKINNKLVGQIAMSDVVKDEALETIEKLHQKGLKVIMITGDNQQAANFVADQLGINEVIAGVLPWEKAEKIKELQEKGHKVVMVGDGINDAPPLVQSDVGIAMATGSDIAIESAGITILGGDIKKLPQAIELAKATILIVKQNLFWAFIYNTIGVPLASGIFYPIFGIFLNPIFAGMAMAVSSVSVVGNSLRLKVKRIK